MSAAEEEQEEAGHVAKAEVWRKGRSLSEEDIHDIQKAQQFQAKMVPKHAASLEVLRSYMARVSTDDAPEAVSEAVTSPKRERPVLALPPWPPVSDEQALARGVASLKECTFNTLAFSSDDLCHLALALFRLSGLPPSVDEDSVRHFILAVRAHMFDNPYHNWYHVFDVTQTSFAFAHLSGAAERFDLFDSFAFLAAAMCHDLEHPGVSAPFLANFEILPGMIKAEILEKHHAIRAFQIMVDQEVGLLKGLSTVKYYRFREVVTRCILATDIARHKDFLDALTTHITLCEAAASNGSPPPTLPPLTEMELIIKCADVSNVCKPAKVARRWALRVTDEFFLQGDVERDLGIDPVTPSCDRHTQSRVASQVGFIDFVCAPYFESMATLYPGLREDVDRMHENSDIWASYSDAELEESRNFDSGQFFPATSDYEQDSGASERGRCQLSGSESGRCQPSGSASTLSSLPSGGSTISSLPSASSGCASSLPSSASGGSARLTPGLQIMVSRARYFQESSAYQESLDSPTDSFWRLDSRLEYPVSGQ